MRVGLGGEVALGEPKGAHSFKPSKPSLARREQGGNATKVCTTMHNQTTRGPGGGSHSPMGAHQGMGVGGGHGRAQGLLVSLHSLQAKALACSSKEGMPARCGGPVPTGLTSRWWCGVHQGRG